jgi:hypothetical protein
MQRIKLKILLPLGQLILAAVLLTVGQHQDIPDKYEPRAPSFATQVCFALNAPALIASWPITWLSLALHIRKPPLAVLSPLDEIPFLIMVIALWYLVARWLEGFRSRTSESDVPMNRLRIIKNLFFVGISAILFYGAVGPFRYSYLYVHSACDSAILILTLLWAIGLLYFPSKSILENFRRVAKKSAL